MTALEIKQIKALHWVLLAVVLAVLAWSGVTPKDRLTWVLEIAPVVIGLALILPTYNKFRLTDLLYILIALHCVVLSVGGRYTYAEVPAGFWVQDFFGWSRNHYDRLGHLFQGFVPAILAREILLRNKVVNGRGWLFLFVVSVCLAFSACYEFIEWGAALVSKEGSSAFLGAQGDIWDSHWDMLLALIGAITAMLTLSGLHDRQLRRISDKS